LSNWTQVEVHRMRRALFALFSIGCLLLPMRSASQTPNQLDGDWVGEFRINGRSVFVRTRIETRRATTSATFDMPLERPRRVALREIRSDSAGVHFELPKESASHVFDGRLTSGTLSARSGKGTRAERSNSSASHPSISSCIRAMRAAISSGTSSSTLRRSPKTKTGCDSSMPVRGAPARGEVTGVTWRESAPGATGQPTAAATLVLAVVALARRL
jgi:hypothetical protein